MKRAVCIILKTNMTHSPASLRAIDLNLLVIFDALMTERHLSRAADRVSLSQPGVSHALQRLRELTGDPLFERHRDGMQPTPRALALAEPIGAALARLQRALISETTFDPSTAKHRFSISMSDGAAALILPCLIKQLRKNAPGIDLRVLPSGPDEGLEHVLSGEVDLGFGVFPNLPNGLCNILLLPTRLICIADAEHPDLAGGLDREAFVALPHLSVSEGEMRGANIDAILRAAGLDRRIMLKISHFLLAPHVLAGTDLLAVMPERVVQILSQKGLRVHDLPVETHRLSGRLIWRERNDEDEAHRWFRGLVRFHFG